MSDMAAPPVVAPHFVVQTGVFTGRILRKIARTPQLLVFSIIQPLILLTLFSQVFQSIAETPGFPAGVSYIDFLVPATLVMTMTQQASQVGVSVATDLSTGVFDRFRSLPINAASALVGRSVADLIRSLLQLVMMLAFAMVVFGYGAGGGVAGLLGCVLVATLFGWAVSWLFIAIGGSVRGPEAAQMLSMMVMFPLMFASSAYVPVESLPPWLAAIAEVNPITVAVDAARNLALYNSWTDVPSFLLVTVVLAVIGVGLSTRAYRRAPERHLGSSRMSKASARRGRAGRRPDRTVVGGAVE